MKETVVHERNVNLILIDSFWFASVVVVIVREREPVHWQFFCFYKVKRALGMGDMEGVLLIALVCVTEVASSEARRGWRSTCSAAVSLNGRASVAAADMVCLASLGVD